MRVPPFSFGANAITDAATTSRSTAARRRPSAPEHCHSMRTTQADGALSIESYLSRATCDLPDIVL